MIYPTFVIFTTVYIFAPIVETFEAMPKSAVPLVDSIYDCILNTVALVKTICVIPLEKSCPLPDVFA